GEPDLACRNHKDEMKPDLVWQLSGHPIAVVDVKYTQDKPSSYQDSLYQMLAYCTAGISSTPEATPNRPATSCSIRILRSPATRWTSRCLPQNCWRRSGTSLTSW
ncbi:MAG: hypothetical protein ACRDRE_18100, partial [Pseudonocardiaceae bacterium]